MTILGRPGPAKPIPMLSALAALACLLAGTAHANAFPTSAGSTVSRQLATFPGIAHGRVEVATRRRPSGRAGMYSCRLREVHTRLEREACGADDTRYGRRR